MGGADRFNLSFLQDWTRRGYECTVVTTLDRNYPWYREYARLTPDIFILPYFLPVEHYPAFPRLSHRFAPIRCGARFQQ